MSQPASWEHSLLIRYVRHAGETGILRLRGRAARDLAEARARGQRLVAHAQAAKADMREGYGIDLTDLTDGEFEARIRSHMARAGQR